MQPIRVTQPKRHAVSSEDASHVPPGRKGENVNDPFVFGHYPTAWTHEMREDEDGKRYGWVPNLSKFIGKPGVNGVRDPGRNRRVAREHMAPMLNGHASKGAALIYPEDPKLGDYRGYDEYYDVRGGGRTYIEPGQEVTISAGGRVTWNREEGIHHSLTFRRFLRSTDLVHPMMEEDFYEAINAAEQKLDRLTQQAGGNPGLQFKVERQVKKIEAMREDWQAYTDEIDKRTEAVTPRKRRGKTPKVEA